MKLTAEEARALNPNIQVDQWVEKICLNIKEKAEKGGSSIRFPYELTEIRGGATPKGIVGKMVIMELAELGYKIDYHWEENQFVDAYISVSW